MATAKALFQSPLAGPHDNSENETFRYNGGAASHQTGEGSKGQNNQRQHACVARKVASRDEKEAVSGQDPVRDKESKVL